MTRFTPFSSVSFCAVARISGTVAIKATVPGLFPEGNAFPAQCEERRV